MLASESAIHNAVVQETNKKQNLAWRSYKQYIFSVGVIHNIYLDSFSQGQKHRIFGTFKHHCNKVDFILNRIINQKQPLLEPPWIAWHRPLSWLTGLTPGWTPTPKLHSFYNDNFDPTPSLTNQK
jgi:hypothetical protein